MAQTQTVSTVTKSLGISNRMIRYYEQIGLIKSQRVDGYAYRVYDETAIYRLRQIILLRKLRVPVKQICEILNNASAARVIEIFEQNVGELDEEITALSTIRSLLHSLAQELQNKASVQLKLDWPDDSCVTALIDSLSFPKNILREENIMSELNKASETLSRLTDRDVRIVYLPPATVASSHFVGEHPHRTASEMMKKFVIESNLPNIKPDMRHYGFNSPNCKESNLALGYEMWTTIPEGMAVPAPLVKKQFEGGLYGAHMIHMDGFNDWEFLFKWCQSSAKYEYRGNMNNDNMFGCLEEVLNYKKHICMQEVVHDNIQFDLLIPIKEKE